MTHYALAIDGPAGAGKSSVAKMLAKRLGYTYIDTGAMYRATTHKALKLGKNIEDPQAFSFLDDTTMTFKNGVLYMDGQRMDDKIRSNEVSNNVSIVASHIPVRNKLVELQQQMAENHDVVMDGRDIGTVVLPDADLKIFLTASVEERAKRRHQENVSMGIESDLEQLKKEIARRDGIDSSRKYNPLKKAEDAIYLDTSNLDMDSVASTIYDLFINVINTKESEEHGS